MRQRDNEIQTSSLNVISFVFVEGVLKLGLPLTFAVQLAGYFIKYGFTSAHVSECFAAMNVFLFTLTVMFEGMLFAIMIRYIDDHAPVGFAESRVLRVMPGAMGTSVPPV